MESVVVDESENNDLGSQFILDASQLGKDMDTFETFLKGMAPKTPINAQKGMGIINSAIGVLDDSFYSSSEWENSGFDFDIPKPQRPESGSAGALEELFMKSYRKVEKNIDATEDLAAAFKRNVVVKDRMYHLKKYKQCFVASQAVDYLVESGGARTRRDAVELGRNLKKNGLFSHVIDQGKEFVDGYLFFRFNKGIDRLALLESKSNGRSFSATTERETSPTKDESKNGEGSRRPRPRPEKKDHRRKSLSPVPPSSGRRHSRSDTKDPLSSTSKERPGSSAVKGSSLSPRQPSRPPVTSSKNLDAKSNRRKRDELSQSEHCKPRLRRDCLYKKNSVNRRGALTRSQSFVEGGRSTLKTITKQQRPRNRSMARQRERSHSNERPRRQRSRSNGAGADDEGLSRPRRERPQRSRSTGEEIEDEGRPRRDSSTEIARCRRPSSSEPLQSRSTDKEDGGRPRRERPRRNRSNSEEIEDDCRPRRDSSTEMVRRRRPSSSDPMDREQSKSRRSIRAGEEGRNRLDSNTEHRRNSSAEPVRRRRRRSDDSLSVSRRSSDTSPRHRSSESSPRRRSSETKRKSLTEPMEHRSSLRKDNSPIPENTRRSSPMEGVYQPREKPETMRRVSDAAKSPVATGKFNVDNLLNTLRRESNSNKLQGMKKGALRNLVTDDDLDSDSDEDSVQLVQLKS